MASAVDIASFVVAAEAIVDFKKYFIFLRKCWRSRGAEGQNLVLFLLDLRGKPTNFHTDWFLRHPLPASPHGCPCVTFDPHGLGVTFDPPRNSSLSWFNSCHVLHSTHMAWVLHSTHPGKQLVCLLACLSAYLFVAYLFVCTSYQDRSVPGVGAACGSDISSQGLSLRHAMDLPKLSLSPGIGRLSGRPRWGTLPKGDNPFVGRQKGCRESTNSKLEKKTATSICFSSGILQWTAVSTVIVVLFVVSLHRRGHRPREDTAEKGKLGELIQRGLKTDCC